MPEQRLPALRLNNGHLMLGTHPVETPLDGVHHTKDHKHGIIVSDGHAAFFYDGRTFTPMEERNADAPN